MNTYKDKYIKYKRKYIELKGGVNTVVTKNKDAEKTPLDPKQKLKTFLIKYNLVKYEEPLLKGQVYLNKLLIKYDKNVLKTYCEGDLKMPIGHYKRMECGIKDLKKKQDADKKEKKLEDQQDEIKEIPEFKEDNPPPLFPWQSTGETKMNRPETPTRPPQPVQWRRNQDNLYDDSDFSD